MTVSADTCYPARVALSAVVKAVHARGWAQGTGGNFSLKTGDAPFRVLMAPSGVDKGSVAPDEFIVVDEHGHVVEGTGKASAETALHLALLCHGMGSVLHSHSVLATVLSLHFQDYIEWQGYEMQKGIRGCTTHDCILRLPVLPNSQDMDSVAAAVREMQQQAPGYGVLLAGHGLYAWGHTLEEARRHLEIFEFLLEVKYQTLRLER